MVLFPVISLISINHFLLLSFVLRCNLPCFPFGNKTGNADGTVADVFTTNTSSFLKKQGRRLNVLCSICPELVVTNKRTSSLSMFRSSVGLGQAKCWGRSN